MKQEISIVIPVYKCGINLSRLCERLNETVTTLTDDFEIILVNDASPDSAWKTIKSLSQKDKRIKGINLSRNFGQHYAIMAGLNYAQGQWIVVMDGDLQDKPEEIRKLYQKALDGYYIVFGQRINRQDGLLKKAGSKAFYGLLSYLTGTRQDASIANFGIYHKKSIDAVLSMGDEIKYFPVMIRWVGFKSCAIEIEHSEREGGQTSYSLTALLSMAIDIMLSFSDKPLKIAVKTGFFIATISFFVAVYIFSKAIFYDITVPGWASTIMSLWFLGGLLMMVIGVVGIYVGKTFDQTKNRPLYIIKQRTWDKEEECPKF